jgi:hypothetical protein
MHKQKEYGCGEARFLQRIVKEVSTIILSLIVKERAQPKKILLRIVSFFCLFFR